MAIRGEELAKFREELAIREEELTKIPEELEVRGEEPTKFLQRKHPGQVSESFGSDR